MFEKDETKKHYHMIDSFRADFDIMQEEVETGKILYNKSIFDLQKESFFKRDVRLFKDIELLKELEDGLNHGYLKIVVLYIYLSQTFVFHFEELL